MMSKSDREILARPEVAELMRSNIIEALRQGAESAANEFMLLSSDWGFRLEDITRPVTIHHGTEDPYVPQGMAEILFEIIPNAVAETSPGQGHLLIIELLPELLAKL